MPIVFRIAFKPPATIGRAQETVTFDGEVLHIMYRYVGPFTLDTKRRYDLF